MPWLQLHIHSSPAEAAAIEDALLTCGAVSVTFQDRADQPILEPKLGEAPLWQQTRITGLFEAQVDTRSISEKIAQQLGWTPEQRWEQLEDKDWVREWMKDYQPIQCGPDLWICPSWQQAPDPSAIVVRLDPGLAFGTGTHPTTLLCLRWLASQDVSGLHVVDYGCGSGILGIAALLKGAEKLDAVDIDPQALMATADNCQRNGIAPERLSTYLPRELPPTQADLVLANILAGPLVELAPTLTALTRPGGRLVLAGLLASQADQVKQAYINDFEFEEDEQMEEWVRLSARRR